MIGQDRLKKQFSELKFLPRSSIIVGPVSSGKKELCKYIANNVFGYNIVICPDNKKETINTTLEAITISSEPTICVIPDFDNANFRVKYSLLKILEEPPKNIYFILTCSIIDNIYPPILSRSNIFTMNKYTRDNMLEYLNINHPGLVGKIDIIYEVCETFNNIEDLISYGVDEFITYVELVVDKIQIVNTANALKITEKLSLKKDEQGYDLLLFLQTADRVYINKGNYMESIITHNSIKKAMINSANKNTIFINWILSLRKLSQED